MTSPADTCVACGGRLSPFGRRLDYEYHLCCVCGTLQLSPLPDTAELAKAYAAEYATASHYEHDPDTCRLSARTYYQAIVNALKTYRVEGRVLDYGAGWGGLCEKLIETGFECEGVEISEVMIDYCQGRGLPVRRGDIGAVEGKQFAAIALCTVFEHLLEHDHWLARANKVLAPNGLLISLQPTAHWAALLGRVLRLGRLRAPLPRLHAVFAPPWHAVLFSLDGMRILVAKHGFDLIEIRPAPQGRERGITGVAQRCLELVNRFGWRVMGETWPLLPSHIFVARKVHGDAERSIR